MPKQMINMKYLVASIVREAVDLQMLTAKIDGGKRAVSVLF
jgi:hypothetical protein